MINLLLLISFEGHSIKKLSFFFLYFLGSSILWGQTIGFIVDPTQNNNPISPYTYGSNSPIPLVNNIPLYRLGGDRLTAYNWENNSSNGGADYCESSGSTICSHEDWYMVPGPVAPPGMPATTLTTFINGNNAVTAASLITLQMAGFVAANGACNCFVTVTAPSDTAHTYWDAVSFSGGPTTGAPVTNGTVVYMNQEMAYLLSTVGGANSSGAKFYDLDNEPGLWNSTHPMCHPNQAACTEVSGKGVSLSTMITSMDPNAQILAPVSYGWQEYVNNQSAPDDNPTLNAYSSNPNIIAYLDYYLATMNSASSAAGRRLLHYLDLHWYPEATGYDSTTGSTVRITNDDTSQGVAIARMQAPRSLWDPTYVESSWITAYSTGGNPITLLPRLQSAVSQYYPGTKLSFSEYQYGSGEDISGGIAEADALGLFGENGAIACRWDDGTSDVYVAAAYNMYLNYDGKGSQFGNTSILASAFGANAVSFTSIYAALDSTHSNRINVIILNKDYSSNHGAAVTLNNMGITQIASITSYRFDTTTSTAYNPTAPTFTANTFSDTLPFRSATLYQLSLMAGTPTPTPSPTPCTDGAGHTCTFTPTPTVTNTPTPTPTPAILNTLYPNPVKNGTSVNFSYNVTGPTNQVEVKMFTLAFRKIYEDDTLSTALGSHSYTLDWGNTGSNIANGLYYVVLDFKSSGSETHQLMKLLVQK